jgi:hypothetical protein
MGNARYHKYFMDNSIWNTLLKLKTMPYGSVHCIYNQELESKVQEIIELAVKNNCLNDATVHDRFTQAYAKWIQSTKLNTITGLDNFKALAFSNGTTEAFDKFYLKHKSRRLRCFRGEYMYHLVAASHYFDQFDYIEDDDIKENDVVIFSLPFAGTGNEHTTMTAILNDCDKLSVPVLVDCCYFGVCGGINFDFDHPCIEEVVFSLSKNFPVQHLRIGMRMSRVDNDDALFVYNKNKYVNRLSAAVGLALIDTHSPDYNYEKYRLTQEQFSNTLGVNPSKSVFFATSTELFSDYNRGTPENRLCFSKYLNSGKLPD